MNKICSISPPNNEKELLDRCREIEGFSFLQLASTCCLKIPDRADQRKGWVGRAVEIALGASSGNKSIPDFAKLGIELKTIPMNSSGSPAESTFVTMIPLLTVHQQTWRTSQCFAKLRRVLWMTIEGDTSTPFAHRRLGRAIIWSPNHQEESLLANDWSELSFMIGTGLLNQVDASIGTCLQVRPKAANSRALCYGFDEHGNKIKTMPRGFYLRASFTENLLLSKLGYK